MVNAKQPVADCVDVFSIQMRSHGQRKALTAGPQRLGIVRGDVTVPGFVKGQDVQRLGAEGCLNALLPQPADPLIPVQVVIEQDVKGVIDVPSVFQNLRCSQPAAGG